MKKQDIIFGIHSVKTILIHQPWQVKRLAVFTERHDKRIQEIIVLAQQHQIAIENFSRSALDKLVDGQHQGVIAFCQARKTSNENDLADILDRCSKPPFLLVLDEVQDPHNLGACLRTANAAGVDAVIIPTRHSVGITPIVRKVASGAVDMTPVIQVTNLARCLEFLKSRHIFLIGLDERAIKTVFQADLNSSVALVLGAEGRGLRQLTRTLCDELVAIPMFGVVESLNVSVAAGICMFECLRQRQ
jgi:23S rRNA (guanosine2251-2'-O)-methyltransferase